LGIAYRDMGLVDEAIAELTRALEDSSLYLQAMELLVDSYKRQGATDAALACLERSATDPSAPDALSESLQYEFGLLYLKQGRMDRAAEVLSVIPDYRDVREHLARLRGGSGRSEPVTTGGAKRRRVSYL
jgi:tetratricopeptide (TPR) repeat protein